MVAVAMEGRNVLNSLHDGSLNYHFRHYKVLRLVDSGFMRACLRSGSPRLCYCIQRLVWRDLQIENAFWLCIELDYFCEALKPMTPLIVSLGVQEVLAS